MLDETDRCPRCGKYAPADPHTCSPAPIVPILEARVADLEAKLLGMWAGRSLTEKGRVEDLERKFDPLRWTQAESDAWHQHIPDTQSAFRALLEA